MPVPHEPMKLDVLFVTRVVCRGCPLVVWNQPVPNSPLHLPLTSYCCGFYLLACSVVLWGRGTAPLKPFNMQVFNIKSFHTIVKSFNISRQSFRLSDTQSAWVQAPKNDRKFDFLLKLNPDCVGCRHFHESSGTRGSYGSMENKAKAYY